MNKNAIKVLHDQHVHTIYSEDSNEEIETYLKETINRGCSYFVMTDHIDYDIKGGNVNWLADLIKEKEEIDSLNIKYKGKITILQGIELGYISSRKKEMDYYLSLLDYDVINLSIHETGAIDYYHESSFGSLTLDEVMNICFDSTISLLDSGISFDVLSHIDYTFKTIYRVDSSKRFLDYRDKLAIIFQKMIKQGITLEINTKVQEALPIEHTKELLSYYYSLGGRDITLSSDAHKVDRYLSNYDKYKDLIKDIGFSYLVYFVKRKKMKYYL